MKLAHVYLRGGTYLIAANAQTVDGVWIAQAPYVLLDESSASDSEIGEAVARALGASRTGIPHPRQEDWKAVAAPLLEAAGVKSHAELMRGSRSVTVESEGETADVVPSRNLGARGGFEPVPDAARRASLADREALGALVGELLRDVCT